MAKANMAVAAILVVEDEPLIRIFTADVLRDAGHYVTEACNGDEAVALLADHQYEAVLTDVTMPGHMDGIELARHVCDAYPGTAVIIASAIDVSGSVPKDVPFIRKPYDVQQLLRLVTTLVQDNR